MASAVLPSEHEVPGLVPRPGSVTWRAAGDARMLAGAGYALLLQVSHPVVGAGVAEHSNFREDPWGRLWRTLDYVSLSVFGGPEAAAEIGRRTRAMHTRIKGVLPDGSRYHALEPAPFAWVHATLMHSMLRVHDAMGLRLSARDREAFYADWRRVGRFVGVRDRDLPEGLAAFERYVADTIRDVLVDNPTVHDVLAELAAPKKPDVPGLPDGAWRALRVPASGASRTLTGGLLEPELRERFGFEWTRADAARFRALSASARAATPVMPRPMREFGPTYIRARRKSIERAGIPLALAPA